MYKKIAIGFRTLIVFFTYHNNREDRMCEQQ